MMRKMITKTIMCLAVCLALSSLSLAESPTVKIWEFADAGTWDIDAVKDWTEAPTYSYASSFLGFRDQNRPDIAGRVTGWLAPPVSGEYTFYIDCIGRGRVYLSIDDNPANMSEILAVDGPTGSVDTSPHWHADAGAGVPVYLETGQYYAVMATQMRDGWSGRLTVGWVVPGEEEIQTIQEIDILNMHPKKARALVPADGAEDVASGEASWMVPPPFEPSEYQVWLATDPNNPDTILDLGTTVAPSINLGSYPDELLPNETYFWRVDVTDPNEGGPIVYEGNWWSFTMATGAPVFTVHPQDVQAPAGTIASFFAEADGLGLPVEYTWYLVDLEEDTPLVENGSFEAPIVSSWPGYVGENDIPGWTLSGAHNGWGLNNNIPQYQSGAASAFHGTGPIPHGDQVLFVQNNPNLGTTAMVSQVIEMLEDGQDYILSFFASPRDTVTLGIEYQVFLGDVEVMPKTLVKPTDPLIYHRFQKTFTYDAASGNTLEFAFHFKSTGWDAGMIDMVSIRPAGIADPQVGEGQLFELIAEQELDSNYYYCVAESDAGWTKSNEARLTVLTGCLDRPVSDFTGDCRVTIADFAVLAGGWLECGWYPQEECWD